MKSKAPKTAAEVRRANRGNVPGVLGMAELSALSGMPDTVSRIAQWVRCSLCEHKWIGLYLPMPISDAAKLMAALKCPMCAAGANEITMAHVPGGQP